MKVFIRIILLICSSIASSYCQVPLECNGNSYRVLAGDDGTYLQEIRQSKINNTISFVDLHFFEDLDINAIAYHPTQNVIYGVLQTPPYRLCRIDAEFNLEVLQTLPLTTDLVFVSGDISPDEQNLVLFGFGENNINNIVALVDVVSGLYDTEVITLQTTNNNQPFIFCADIAFHPTNGKLYGFDFKNGRLVTLDIIERIIDNNIYSISGTVLGNVPSIFFNDEGELYGIGTNLMEEDESRGYYRFDLLDGQPDLLQELDIERNQDACSCPYRINLLNEVRQRKNAPCTELVFELTLINRTISDQPGLTLKDTFPSNVVIEGIGSLPFDGIIDKGIGGNILEINDLYLPLGEFSFEVTLRIGENAEIGAYENRAILSGLLIEDFELESILSDDPLTAIPDDATMFSIEALETSIGDAFFGICQGGEATLHAGIYGANNYQWSTGETSQEIVVDAEGEYQVTVTTDCDQTVGTASVVRDEVIVELGKDITVESGETIMLQPVYTSQSNVRSFNWETNNTQSLDCPNCKNLILQPLSDTELQLSVENATGCRSDDRIRLKVVGVKIYAPNIFTPDNRTLNSTFYLLGNVAFDIASFEVYDQWGSLMFLNKNFEANEPSEGWDGTNEGRACEQGVYLWTATVRYKSGELEMISGDVTLMK